jgi:hypothetical protein
MNTYVACSELRINAKNMSEKSQSAKLYLKAGFSEYAMLPLLVETFIHLLLLKDLTSSLHIFLSPRHSLVCTLYLFN